MPSQSEHGNVPAKADPWIYSLVRTDFFVWQENKATATVTSKIIRFISFLFKFVP